jgi:hypothetical protein
MTMQFLETYRSWPVYEAFRFQFSLFGYVIAVNLVAIGVAAFSGFTAYCLLKLLKGLKVGTTEMNSKVPPTMFILFRLLTIYQEFEYLSSPLPSLELRSDTPGSIPVFDSHGSDDTIVS